MTFQEFATNYRMNRTMALDMARIFGVSMAQVQLWVLRIVKGN